MEVIVSGKCKIRHDLICLSVFYILVMFCGEEEELCYVLLAFCIYCTVMAILSVVLMCCFRII